MYQVLYRKWRPKTFDEVVGQSHITETLKNEVESGKVAHAYLFTGIRGTGKTTCAKILSKAINCLSPVRGNPCGECQACKLIDSEQTMDITELDAAGNNRVDDIRELVEEIIFTPTNLKKRVYIIDEVHMLSIGAFNAFLKTLEEPAEHVVFILATTEISKIPATILSRCQRFDFYRISVNDMSNRLIYIAQKEGITLEKEAARLIAKLSNGALRDALSILDRCIMNASDRTNEGNQIKLDYKAVSDTVGIVGKESLYKLVSYILASDIENIIKQTDYFYKSSKDMPGLLKELSEHFRDIMLYKTVSDFKEVSGCSEEDEHIVKEHSDIISLDKVISILEKLEYYSINLRKNNDSRVALEIAFIKLCESIKNDSAQKENDQIEILSRRVSGLERDLEMLKSNQAAVKSVKNQEIEKKEDRKQQTKAGQNIQALDDNIKQIMLNAKKTDAWQEVLKILRDKSPSMASSFAGSKAYINGNYLFIESDNELAFTLLRKSDKRNEIRKIVEQVIGKKYNLGPYKKR
ncbi:MAG: DNA polymerase III subunit gamma/tau [Clostridia bacterium]|nr:DNA polymerase III subunit gamma/tau [Clostridia bacterium]